MLTFTLAQLFSVRKGFIYSYNKPIENEDIGIEITEKIADLMGQNNFISSVTRYNGTVYAYIDQEFPESVNADGFNMLCDVAQSLQEYSDAQQEYLRQQQEAVEAAQEQSQEPTPEEP